VTLEYTAKLNYPIIMHAYTLEVMQFILCT